MLRTASADSEYHHRFTLAAARIGALLQLGHYTTAESELQLYLKEAAATENINAELHINMAHAWADINAGRARAAISRLDLQREQLPRHSFGVLHVLHMVSVLRIACVTGEYAWGLDSTRAHWQAFERSVVRRSDMFSMFAYEAHACLLLCHAARTKTEPKLSAHRAGLKKARHKNAPGELLGIDARVALLARDKPRALKLLAASVDSFDAAGARDQAARARFALGTLQAGDAGIALQQAALSALTALGVAEPERFVSAYFPELFRADVGA